ncbi:MAG: Y-family DNA polymerase [Gammaproteobacteria bacterium]
MHPLWLAIRLPQLPQEVLSPSATEETPRNPRAEREALKALCAAAYRFSGTLTAQPRAPAPGIHTLWLEIGSSLRLFGGLDSLLAGLAASLARLGYRHRLGVAPTLEGASVVADARLPPCRTPDELFAALKPLPAALLALPGDVLAALEGSGLTRIGQVLDLPLDAVAMRFGYAVTDYFGRLTGRLADPRRYYRLPERYRRRFEFDGEIELIEALLFPLRRLLAEFQEYLVARDTGVQEFRVELEHDGHPPGVLAIGMGSPSRDAAHFQVLLRERFERAELAGPVRALTLAADRFASPRARQLDLLSPRGSEDEEWDTLLDRLRARLGPETVRGLGLAADYRPEKSWCSLPPGLAATQSPQARRPLWLLPEPQPLAQMPQCVSGPERIEGGWWDGLDATRDYYVAQSGAARLWVYRERGSGGWFLQGLWS